MNRRLHVTALYPLAVGLLLLTACSRLEKRTLSGHSVTVVFSAQVDQSVPALIYETRLQMDDAAGLVAEAAAIWQEFRDTEPRLGKVRSVAMSANEPARADARPGPRRSWHFVIRRNADGTWPSEPQGWLAGS
jgi:hypothetical protein